MSRFATSLIVAVTATILAATPARADDQDDALIDVFSIPGFVVDRVETSIAAGAVDQQIDGHLPDSVLRFRMARPACRSLRLDTRGRRTACDSLFTSIGARFRTVEHIQRFLKVERGSARRVIGNEKDTIRGVQIDYNDGECRGVVAWTEPQPRRKWNTLLIAKLCGPSKDVLTDYMSRFTGSNPEKNRFDRARGPGVAAAPSPGFVDPSPIALNADDVPWIDIASMTRVTDIAIGPAPAAATGGVIDPLSQEITGVMDGVPVSIVVRDDPCTRRHSDLRTYCYLNNIKHAIDRWGSLGKIVQGSDIKGRQIIRTDSTYGAHFPFKRDGATCHGVYIGIGRGLNRIASYPMTVIATLCGASDATRDDFVAYLTNAQIVKRANR